jgi:hypothetical protein
MELKTMFHGNNPRMSDMHNTLEFQEFIQGNVVICLR